eukprot:COSAG06_NODE_4085_length_4589_cov_18.717817_7_plen_165_part_00
MREVAARVMVDGRARSRVIDLATCGGGVDCAPGVVRLASVSSSNGPWTNAQAAPLGERNLRVTVHGRAAELCVLISGTATSASANGGQPSQPGRALRAAPVGGGHKPGLGGAGRHWAQSAVRTLATSRHTCRSSSSWAMDLGKEPDPVVGCGALRRALRCWSRH